MAIILADTNITGYDLIDKKLVATICQVFEIKL